MRLRNHTYIHDAIMYQNYVSDDAGAHWRMSELWEKWSRKHPNAKDPIDKVRSFDDGYFVNNIIDIRVAGNHEVMLMTTESNRKMWCGPQTQFLTENGYKEMRNIGMGAPLIVMDNYKNYFGDTIKLSSSGNARARALLRNHGVQFEIDKYGGTIIGDRLIYVVDWDTEGVTCYHDNKREILTYGLNNYRESLKELYGLPDYRIDRVVSVNSKTYTKYLIAIYVDGPQNVVLTNGLVVQSTQTEVRNDW